MLKLIWYFNALAWFFVTLIYLWKHDIACIWLAGNCVFLSLVIIYLINEETS